MKLKRIILPALVAGLGLALVVNRSSKTDDDARATNPEALSHAATSEVAPIPAMGNNVSATQYRSGNAGAPTEIVEAFQQRFSALAGSDPRAAFALAKSLPKGDMQRDTIRALLCGLVETDPSLTASLAADLSSPLAEQMAAALASAWGKKDLPAAIRWAKDLAEGKAKHEALLSLSADWAALDPLDAAEFARITLPEQIQFQFLNITGGQWASKDPAAAVSWSQRLPEGDSRDTFLAAVSSTLSESFPAEAAQLVASLTPGPRQEDAALTVALQWSRKDPEAAAAWAQKFPSDLLRLKTLLNLVSALTSEEPEAMRKVLDTWPDGPEREQAIDRYLSEINTSQLSEPAENPSVTKQ